MNSCDLVATVTAIACAIAKCLPKEELELLTVVLTQLADTLATIAVQEEICNSKAEAASTAAAPTDAAVIVESNPSVPSGSI